MMGLMLLLRDPEAEEVAGPRLRLAMRSPVSQGIAHSQTLSTQLHQTTLTMTVYRKQIETDGQHYNRNNDSRDDVNYIRHYLILYTRGVKKYGKRKYHKALEFSSAQLLESSNLRYLKWSNLPLFWGMQWPWASFNLQAYSLRYLRLQVKVLRK